MQLGEGGGVAAVAAAPLAFAIPCPSPGCSDTAVNILVSRCQDI